MEKKLRHQLYAYFESNQTFSLHCIFLVFFSHVYASTMGEQATQLNGFCCVRFEK